MNVQKASNGSLAPDASRFYLPQLDGLRFLAFFFVFIHHFRLVPNTEELGLLAPLVEGMHNFGWIGVELFFVLSAYLMTSILLLEYKASQSISISKFFLRRILRIWPLYFFVLTVGFVGIPLAWKSLFLSSEHIRLLNIYLIPYLMFFGNIPVAIYGYPGTASESVLALLWTISFEEQFYLILPFFILVLAPARIGTWIRVLIGIFAFGLAVRLSMQLMDLPPHPAIWVIPIARPDSFLVGILIAVANEHYSFSDWLTEKRQLFVLLSASLCIVSVSQYPNIDTGSWHRLWIYSAISICFGAILTAFLSNPASFHIRIFSSQPLTYLGRISYGLYVYHLLVLVVVNRAFGAMVGIDSEIFAGAKTVIWIAEGFTAFGVTVAIAIVSYRWLERPFLRRKERYESIKSRPA